MRARLIVFLVALVSALVMGQAPPKEEFEVVAIRPFAPDSNGGFPLRTKGGPGTDDPTRMTFTNYSIQNLLVMAYSLKGYQLTAPAWLNEKEARFNIEARVRAGATKEQANKMIQNLLADRFELTLHRETKEMPLYELLVGKDGPKLKEASNGPGGFPVMNNVVMRRTGTERIIGHAQTMDALADRLSAPTYGLGLVIDKTGLTGVYDFQLEFAASDSMLASLRQRGVLDADTPPAFPEFAIAIQQQLGLRVERKKGSIEILVIDHCEKQPTEN